MEALELWIKLIKELGYEYPYTQIAEELGVTRQAVWRVCNGEARSQTIENHITKKLGYQCFPVKKSLREVA
jgi:predicted transcriptional regulator